jgi:excisionase family DNA binding protein
MPKMIKISDLFYTEIEAARALGFNRITIWRWIKQGKLHSQHIGNVVFIPREEIDLIQMTRTKGQN